jgi:hypothetical protein
MNFAVLERGFLGERKTFKVEKIKTFRKTEEFFKDIENSKGGFLLETRYPSMKRERRTSLGSLGSL